MRKHYIDNLRWLTLLLLVPYHTAMAWNYWGEPNYIFFEGNRLISSIVVFFSPYFMPLLFVLAGISTRLALQKRTVGQYLAERVKKLLLPFLFGTIALMPIMSYIGDRFNYGYSGGFSVIMSCSSQNSPISRAQTAAFLLGSSGFCSICLSSRRRASECFLYLKRLNPQCRQNQFLSGRFSFSGCRCPY